jgi:hypothetical protein
MTLTCADCTTVYAVGIRACPHCRSERIVREDNGMPKITVAAGATHPDTDLTEDEKGGEQSSPGTSSSTSPENSPTKPEPSESSRPSRARTTESRSKKARTGSSSAGSTDGGQTAPRGADTK